MRVIIAFLCEFFIFFSITPSASLVKSITRKLQPRRNTAQLERSGYFYRMNANKKDLARGR